MAFGAPQAVPVTLVRPYLPGFAARAVSAAWMLMGTTPCFILANAGVEFLVVFGDERGEPRLSGGPLGGGEGSQRGVGHVEHHDVAGAGFTEAAYLRGVHVRGRENVAQRVERIA